MAHNPDRYSRVAIILHWAIAAAIVFQIVLGWRMGGENSASTYAVFQLHKSIGITILLLSVLRLVWRLTHRAPPPPAEMPKYERIASAITHIAFYMIMIGLPISGWVLVSAAKIDIPTLLYSTIPWPHIGFIADMQPEMKSAWEVWAANAHSALAWLTYILLAVHIGAVIKHQWLDKQALLARMTGSGQAGLKEPRLWGALAIIVLIGISATLYALPAGKAAAPVADATQEIDEQSAGVRETASTETPEVAATEQATTEEEAEPEAEAKMPLSQWSVNKSSAALTFATSWSGEAINGRFGDWDADVKFSPDDLPNSRIRVTISTHSVSTGDAQRDSTLPGTDFFDTSAHPNAVFTANRIRKTGDNRYVASGTMSLRGVSAPMSVNFRLNIDGDNATVSGNANLDRTTFGVGQGMYADTGSIPAMVRVNFNFTAKRNP